MKHPLLLAARSAPVLLALAALGLAPMGHAQSASVVQFPAGTTFWQNSSFASIGTAAFLPSSNDVLWSFSLETGQLLDPGGLALPAPATASDAYRFAGERVGVPGWFPSQGLLVADVSDPTNLSTVGIIPFPSSTNIQGQNVEVHPGGTLGFVAGFPDDRLYSFDVTTLAHVHFGGLLLSGNPDRIALAGDRLALVDTTNGAIMVVDVSSPATMVQLGTIALPGPTSFGSNDNIVFAADGRTGFVSSNERVLYSFDVQTLALLDPDGLAFGTQGFADDVAIHGTTVACVHSRGLAFVDASDPTDLKLQANAAFAGTVAPQGDAKAVFSADGSIAAVPMVFPASAVYSFDTLTGAVHLAPFAVDDQPNYMATLGATNRLAILCPGFTNQTAWLVDGLLGAPAISTYCTAKTSSCGGTPALAWSGIPSAGSPHGFVVSASGAREGKFGLLLNGPNGRAALPFQGGTLCIDPQGLRRSPAVVATGGTLPPACDATFSLDLNAFASGNAGGNPAPFLTMPGQQVSCQWWGRDTVANGSYLSDALSYLVGP